MKPLDFYLLGSQLAQTARTEAEFRTAIGRMYYGLHHEACCRYFRVNPTADPLERGKRHYQLVEKFKISGNSVTVRIGALLGQLSRMRNISDYELSNPVRYNSRSHNTARFLMVFALTVASELLEALDDYSQGPASDGCRCPTVYPAVRAN